MERGDTVPLLFIQTVFMNPRTGRASGRMKLAKMHKVESCPPGVTIEQQDLTDKSFTPQPASAEKI